MTERSLKQNSSTWKGVHSPSLSSSNYDFMDGADSLDFAALKEKCVNICSQLLSKIHQDVLSVPAASCSAGFKSKSTVKIVFGVFLFFLKRALNIFGQVGMMLSGMVIDNMVMGSPAFNSNMLDRGDVIVQIDHQDVSMDGLSTALLGSDIPGSSVVITVKKSSPEFNGRTVDVVLTRMATSFIADRCRMFELYARMKDSVQSSHDSKTASIVDECIELWTKMLIADSARENLITNNVLSLQGECASLLSVLKLCVEHLSLLYPRPTVSHSLSEGYRNSENRYDEFEVSDKLAILEKSVLVLENTLNYNRSSNLTVTGQRLSAITDLNRVSKPDRERCAFPLGVDHVANDLRVRSPMFENSGIAWLLSCEALSQIETLKETIEKAKSETHSSYFSVAVMHAERLKTSIREMVSRSSAVEGAVSMLVRECEKLNACIQEMTSEVGSEQKFVFLPKSELFDVHESIREVNLNVSKMESCVELIADTSNSKVDQIMALLLARKSYTENLRERSACERTANGNEVTGYHEGTGQSMDPRHANEFQELKVRFAEWGYEVHGLVLEVQAVKGQIESIHSVLLSKIYGLNGYLKMMVPRVKLDEALADLQRRNGEIRHLRSCMDSMVSKNDFVHVEEELLQQKLEIERLSHLTGSMVRKSDLELAKEEKERATKESLRLLAVIDNLVPKSRLEDANEQLLQRGEELRRMQKEMENMVPRHRFEVLQKNLESMVPKDEFLNSQAQIRRLQSEIAWAKSLISELLSKVKNPEVSNCSGLQGNASLGSINVESKSVVEKDSNGRSDVVVLLSDVSKKVSGSLGNILFLTSQINWMKNRMESVQQRVRYKLECLEKYMKIMIPRQMLDASENRLSQRQQEIEHLKYRLEGMVPKSVMLAAQAEIERLSAILEKFQKGDNLLVPKAQFYALQRLLISRSESGGKCQGGDSVPSTEIVDDWEVLEAYVIGVEANIIQLELALAKLDKSGQQDQTFLLPKYQ